MKRYPRQLSAGANNIVIALNQLEVAKIYEDELAQLHKAGFAHRDIFRPSDMAGERYDNVFLTDKGLRLIDVGISALRRQVGGSLFERFVEQELKEVAEFKVFFLNR